MYRAYIKLPNVVLKRECEMLADAMQWLDNQNENQENRTWVEEIIDGCVKDWFVYTEERR
jgi:hypothetical protein